MTDPVTTAVATAIAGKAPEALTDQAREAVAMIAKRVRRKFHDRPADLAILDAAQAGPDANGCTAFAHALWQAMLEDANFSSDIRALWNQAHILMTAESSDGVNIFHGRAEKVMQLRDIHGDLNIS
jgi:hypothetical protein